MRRVVGGRLGYEAVEQILGEGCATPDRRAAHPRGMENNWVQTIPGRGWNTLFRRYGPLEPWFEKTWRPGDPELVK